jgi:butyrate kinase
MRKLYGEGGVFAYLGTRDIREVEERIDLGDSTALLVYDAMLYQIGKAIGSMASTMDFDVDAVVLTGGLANSEKLTDKLKSKMDRLAPVFVFAGSNENEALAEATLSALGSGCNYMDWPVSTDSIALLQAQA